ncbi:hypothetical protein PK98_09555 [Croceibacterium mercuriale]|uniref:PepSY domain-containing protein n=1 Tax=Croceibacterium mercuriale TaxID=1572751 RepID=A0A0B2C3I8_9SPHN|nr:PepSY domain-containing protein [Croceibacterium mercuriale]KHL26596.1 hypothetical protein PK98_09555 [Croceibacterium mercuriale]
MRLIRFLLPLLLATPFVAAPANAGDPDEAARIRAAVARGQVLPLPRILALARTRVPGDMLKVELEEEDGRIAYEIKILTPAGRIREVTLDARTGRVLEVEDD